MNQMIKIIINLIIIMNLTCPTNGKDYIMPTKHWLKPLQEIISTDIATLQISLL